MSLPALSPPLGQVGREEVTWWGAFWLVFLGTLDTRSYTFQIFHPALKNLFPSVENVSVSGSHEGCGLSY